jgi:hypothetical protein
MRSVTYLSIEDIRTEKVRAKRQMKRSFDNLRGDVSNCFMPTNNVFLNSSSRWMNVIGYGITAYKTFTTFRSVFSFLARWI